MKNQKKKKSKKKSMKTKSMKKSMKNKKKSKKKIQWKKIKESKVNLLIMCNICAKFDQNTFNSLFSMSFGVVYHHIQG